MSLPTSENNPSFRHSIPMHDPFSEVDLAEMIDATFDSDSSDVEPEIEQQSYRPVSVTVSDPSTADASTVARSSDERDLEHGLTCPDFYLPDAASTKEHFRDISFLGPITLHRLFVVLWLAGSGTGLYFLQNYFWPPTDDVDVAWSLLGLIWLVPLPATLAFVVGILWFRYDSKLDDVGPIPHRVAFRIVSRGINPECLLSTIRRCQLEMRRNALFPYLIEVVTDGDVFQAPDEPDIVHLRVPEMYSPSGGARFKARALHYACERSVMPGDTWIVHLDEESQPTSSCIKGIAKMVRECEENGDTDRIGQGMILYHRGWRTHPLLTLADMRRTGDDCGHFYLQHRMGYTIFGLHGSYVVCRQDAEARIGFDVGPRGSITEDAWWVLIAIQNGYRTKWVEGYMEEQATQSLSDFVKQRRRWYVGLLKVGAFCPVKFKHRILLCYNTMSWIVLPVVVPLQIAYLVLSFVYNKQIGLPIRVLTNLIFSVAVLVYFSGLVINMREHGTPWWRVPFWMVLQAIGMPFFFLLEVCGIVSALFSPFSQGAKGFHVVKKDGSADVDGDVVESEESE